MRGRHAAPRVRRRPRSLALPLLGATLATGVALSTPGGGAPLLVPVAAVRVAVPATPLGLPGGIEPLAAYDPQTTCDPSAKPGVRAFAAMVLRTYPDTGSDGIVRACAVGGRSEHKEGRAWDWKVSARVPRQKAEAGALLHWLLARDAAGHNAAMARRLGVMYIIWDRKIWTAAKAAQGWRAYRGAEAHVDHVHLSFTRAGAAGRTSYWQASGAAPAGGATPAELARYGRTILRAGATGPAVRLVQRVLKLRPVDGRFGPRTRAAVIALQKRHHLLADGEVGPKTWRVLGQARPAPRPAPPRLPAQRRGDPAVTELSRYRKLILRSGAHGTAVVALQHALHVTADGDFGPQTRGAVLSVQQRHHLLADGEVGPRTWAALGAR